MVITRYPLTWLRTEVVWRCQMLGYWLRPYDLHLDDRRWRWTESGCHQITPHVVQALREMRKP